MRQTGSEHLSDADLLANASMLAERWERTLQNGGGHKGADRPDRSSKRKSHSGPDRKNGAFYEAKTPSYTFRPMQGDLWRLGIDRGTLGVKWVKVASWSVPADTYGDDYGTGRHYEHIADQEYTPRVERGMGRTARSGAGIKMILTPHGAHEYTYPVSAKYPQFGNMIVNYDHPERSTQKRRIRKVKVPTALVTETVDDSSLFYDGSDRGNLTHMQRTE